MTHKLQVFHIIIIDWHTSAHYRSSGYNEENCNLPTMFEVPSDKRPKQIQNELLSIKWQHLKWKRERQYTNGSHQDLVRLVPCVKMVPDSDIQEKLGDVKILPGYVVLDVDGKRRQMLTPSNPNNVMILRRTFERDLTSMNDELAITVDLEYCDSEIAIEVEIILVKNSLIIIEPVNIPPCDVLQTFSNLLAQNEEESKEKYCDVKLVATEQQEDKNPAKQVNFYAHKAILAARSPVFAKMFSHDMKESATNTVKLPDIEPAVLKELLTYVYTNEYPNIKSYAVSILYNAEKYKLEHLKALCEQRLSYDLQTENAAKILLLADTCSASQLKRNALLFTKMYGGRVLATKEWEEVKPNAELLQELLSTIFEKKKCMAIEF